MDALIDHRITRRWDRDWAFGALRRALIALPIALCVFAGATRLGAEGPAPVVPNLGQLGVHVTERGETMFSIASRYGLRVDHLARLNATTADTLLVPGRPLWVPLASAVNARADAPASGSTSAGNTAVDAPDTYTVVSGDTLYGLSRRFGVSVDDLKRWNGLPIDGSLRAGETLVLLGEGGDVDSRADPAAHTTTPGSVKRQAYVVATGDTLTSIAQRFGSTVPGLKISNGLIGDDIREGQTLLVPTSGSGAPGAGGGPKRIEIDVSDQRMYVWQGDDLVWNFVASTGMAGYGTRRGAFAVQSKIPNAWSSPWQLWMPNWLGIYWAGGSENGIHALPIVNGQRLWAGYLGTPISYGCVVLGVQEAAMLYDWAEIGTPVEIHD